MRIDFRVGPPFFIRPLFVIPEEKSEMDTGKLIGFAQSLVQCPSLSCEEGAVAELVRAEMEELGFDRVTLDENGSVIGILEAGGGDQTLLLDAHTDTVDVTGGVSWQRDPFSGLVSDGFLHGRGSADMKGALAAMVYGAASMDRSRLSGRVVVCASPMEEVLEGVALEAVMKAFPPDFVVIGEATDLNLARGGRGRAEIHLEAVGVPTHSSAPHLGRNAVLDMIAVIQGVERIDLPNNSLMGPAILALTEISSVPYPANSVIPSILPGYVRPTPPSWGNRGGGPGCHYRPSRGCWDSIECGNREGGVHDVHRERTLPWEVLPGLGISRRRLVRDPGYGWPHPCGPCP